MFELFTKKKISVTFVDHASGEPFVRSEMPIEQLPDTFALHTDLDIAGQKYVVVGAEPPTKEAFAKTRRLRVTLQKVETVDPKKILFSLPSICNSALPELTDAPSGAGEIRVLHEDDWRQCEFVSVAYSGEVSRELIAIRQIHEKASMSVGWSAIHLRELIPSPLATAIGWQTVVEHLGAATSCPKIAFMNKSHVVRNAVAFEFGDGVLVWGVEQAGRLVALCVENIRSANEATVSRLTRLADALSLVLVNWCSCQAYAPRGSDLEGASGSPWKAPR